MCTFTRNMVCGKPKEVRQNGKKGQHDFSVLFNISLPFLWQNDVINRSIFYILAFSSSFH